MKKHRLFLLPLFCMLLAACSETGGKSGDDTTPVVTNNARLNFTARSIVISDSFTLTVSEVPSGMTPSWSLEGNAVTYDLLNSAKTSVLVEGIAVGTSTVKVAVGEKNLSCVVTVSEKPNPREPLSSPILKLNEEKDGLTWDAIEGAEGYLVQVNDDNAVLQTNPGYTFSQAIGNYSVKVIAKADLSQYNSEESEYVYETKSTSLGSLSYDEESVICASYVGYGLESKLGENEFVPVAGNSFEAPENGLYTIHVINGFDENNKIYYVSGEETTKTIYVLRGVKLQTPVLQISEDRTCLIWEEVLGATGYSIQVNDQPAETIFTPKYVFASDLGEYSVKVTALSTVPEFDSDECSYSYEVKYTSLGELTYEDGKITWASLAGAGIEFKVKDDPFAKVSGDEYTPKKYGTYTFHAMTGMDVDNNIYYVESKDSTNQREILIAPEKVIVEDGSDENNTDLMDRYITDKWTNSWEMSFKTKLYLEDEINSGYTDGDCVRLHYWANETNYRFSQEIEFVKSYDTLSFALKGDGSQNSKFLVRLIVTKDLTVGDISLTGVSATYRLTNPSTDWTRYTADLNDDNAWSINYGGSDYAPSKIKELLNLVGYDIDSWTELLPYFDTCAFIVSGKTEKGSERDVYFDDVVFSNDHGTSGKEAIIRPLVLRQKYALTTAALSGELRINDDLENGTLIGASGTSILELPVTLSLNDEQLVVTCTTTNRDFVVTLQTENGGATWSYISGSGKLKVAMSNMTLGEMLSIDNFANYSETGVGYDATHAEGFSGLRANYYFDYYNEHDDGTGVGSPVGGPNWWLMGSNDYLDYSEDGCLDAGSARLKSINSYRDMRYLSVDLAKAGMGQIESAPSLGKGYKKMSIMAKGDADRDVKIMLFAFYRSSVDPTTQRTDRTGDGSEIVIPKGSNWKNYSIELNTAKRYYGIEIIVKSGGDSETSTAYIYVDNIVFNK